jgi:hypothetical protein
MSCPVFLLGNFGHAYIYTRNRPAFIILMIMVKNEAGNMRLQAT